MAAHQAPLSLRFSRQEHWSGLPCPSPMHACRLSHFSRVQLWQRPYRQQPTRLLCPWDSLGKNSGVGCLVLQSWLSHTPQLPRANPVSLFTLLLAFLQLHSNHHEERQPPLDCSFGSPHSHLGARYFHFTVFPHGHKFSGIWETSHDYFFFFFWSHSVGRLIPDQVNLLFDKSLQVLISIDK